VVGLTKRADIIVFDAEGRPFMLVECKAPQIPISQATFDQAARYNLTLEVPYLVVTNGMEIFAAEIFIEQKKWEFLKEIPFSK
jgi:type I site-specific restriction endonuclease